MKKLFTIIILLGFVLIFSNGKEIKTNGNVMYITNNTIYVCNHNANNDVVTLVGKWPADGTVVIYEKDIDI